METTANLHPKEGVFWILTKDENLIKQGKFQLLFDFCGYESHDTVWKKQQKAHSELLGFDYEFFPRGRIWKNNADSQKAYTILIARILNCKAVLKMINKIFCLNDDYVVALEG